MQSKIGQKDLEWIKTTRSLNIWDQFPRNQLSRFIVYIIIHHFIDSLSCASSIASRFSNIINFTWEIDGRKPVNSAFCWTNRKNFRFFSFWVIGQEIFFAAVIYVERVRKRDIYLHGVKLLQYICEASGQSIPEERTLKDSLKTETWHFISTIHPRGSRENWSVNIRITIMHWFRLGRNQDGINRYSRRILQLKRT